MTFQKTKYKYEKILYYFSEKVKLIMVIFLFLFPEKYNSNLLIKQNIHKFKQSIINL